MFKFSTFLTASLLALGLAAPAHASTIYTLDIISTPSIGSGALGTVTLEQVNANQVNVSVDLADDTAFVRTGGPHHAFAYNLNLAPSDYSVTITSPSGAFSLATSLINTPFGTFTNGMNCTGCGNGGSSPNPGPLEFFVYSTSGISLSNFVANSLGYFFSADVIGPAGGTGNIAAMAPPPSTVPLPAALPLLVGGLFGVAGFRRTRKQKTA